VSRLPQIGTQRPDIDSISALLDTKGNIWHDLLRLAHHRRGPLGRAARPNPALLKKNQEEALERTAAQAKVLEAATTSRTSKRPSRAIRPITMPRALVSIHSRAPHRQIPHLAASHAG